VHEHDRERVLSEAQRFEWAGDRFETEYRMVAADGGTVWVIDQRVLVRDDEGEPCFYQGFLVDITARKEAEARYRSLVERLPIVTYVSPLTADTTLSYLSPQVEELIGYEAAECVADPDLVRRVIHPDDIDRVVSEARRVRRDFEEFNGEYRLVGRDGRTIWVRDQMVLVRDERGEPLCFQGFLLDITARKQLEEQLEQSQRLDVVGRLAGGIAHDFNNLMTAINGYTGFALERAGDHDPRLRSDLQEVQRAADRAASLTQQLLAFSRRQVLQPRPVDLGTVVGDVHDLLARLIGEDVELVTYADPFAKQVLADPGRLEQVLVNLAVNARDAMPGGGTLTIETRDVELGDESAIAGYGAPAGRYAALVVRDTGSGMDEETRALVFEPFFTTKEVGHGSGLGLSTVYGIVKQSGGWITIESAPEAGTEVTIYLPATDTTLRAEEQPAAERSPGSETVLLVEDEEIVRTLVAEMLERQGYRVVDAPGPHEAMERFEEMSCDLLLTDVVMPRMNGRELARHLRERKPELTVVYTSGYTADRVLEQGSLEPGEHFLQKPFNEQALATAVREALDAAAAPAIMTRP
jgi:PAS domain S-box-containing protein